jgi:glycosyltransferase involved in cell wall biosynthesis
MSRVALLIPSFTEADAVSTDVLGMYRALRTRGHDVCVLAAHWTIEGLPVRPFRSPGGVLRDRSAVLIYHFSTGCREATEVFRGAACRRLLKYHNVTPAAFFEGIDQEYALSCHSGREVLALLARDGLDGYLADSDYNLRELLDAGARTGAVVPPFHNIHRLLEVEPDPEVLARCRDGKVNFLVVGRLAPNKGHDTLLEAFALYQGTYNRDSRLFIVGKGDERLAVYTDALRARVRALGLEESVVFTGGVSAAALKTYYQTAFAFVITSRHEGFCVPLVEAMALGTPVLAVGAAAVPATVGDAGLVWEESDPQLLAASMHRLATDRALAAALGARGRRRFAQHFTNAQVEQSFLDALHRLCGLERDRPSPRVA